MYQGKILSVLICGFFIVVFLPVINFAQNNFERTYGGSGDDFGCFVVESTDGGYIVTGGTETFSESGRLDAFLMKTDIKGDIVWFRTYGGAKYDFGNCVQPTADGGYIIVGGTSSSGVGSLDVYLIKTDADGNEVWTRTYGSVYDDQGTSVQQTVEGGYIFVRYTETYGLAPSLEDFYLTKTDALGNEIFTKTYGGPSWDYCWSVQVCEEGGYAVAGYTNSFGAGAHDVYFVRTDTSGNVLWSSTYGDANSNNGYCVQQTMDKGFILAGTAFIFFSMSNYNNDVYLIKTDSNGDTMWTNTYGNPSEFEEARSVRQTGDGGYIIAGWTYPFEGSKADVYLLKTDASGNEQWVRTYGGTEYKYGESVQQTSDGGYVVAGYTRVSQGGARNIYLVKTDNMGELTGVTQQLSHSFPSEYKLFKNYPNPFNAVTKIRYSVKKVGLIRLKVYNLLGKEIETLANDFHQSGEYEIIWNAKDLPSGLYLCCMEIVDLYNSEQRYQETIKMIFMK